MKISRSTALTAAAAAAAALAATGVTYASAASAPEAAPAAPAAVAPAPEAAPAAPMGGAGTGNNNDNYNNGKGNEGHEGRGGGHEGWRPHFEGRIQINERSYSAHPGDCITVVSGLGARTLNIRNDSHRVVEVFRGAVCDNGAPVAVVGPHSQSDGVRVRCTPGVRVRNGVIGSFRVVGGHGGWGGGGWGGGDGGWGGGDGGWGGGDDGK
ncbi:hypothetical protein [Streptomyces sp. NBC_00557]|uniref:hypothetical protein n=1 Tax=Streptomyces sp. NBC_00557 TaxID=2975776 RepID=UPI002E81507E|nr:hypothetical protein [Streptomyces sp. NBC_00557]WUC36110.1 hypothetical protein OG956_18785 [Streptomyces sp. NBC_00557]